MSDFQREQRYIVLKLKDMAGAGITQEEYDAFNAVCDKVNRFRNGAGKGPLLCVVVEKEWEEYEPTWAAIQARMSRA